MTLGRFLNRDHIGRALAPRQFIAVMLIRADEDDRPFCRRDGFTQLVPLIQICRNTKIQNSDQSIYRSRTAGAGKDDHIVVVSTESIVDDLSSFLSQSGGLQACATAFGVSVCVRR